MQDDKQPDVTLSDLDNSPPNVPASGGDTLVASNQIRKEWLEATARISDLEEQLRDANRQLDEANRKVTTVEILDDLLEPSANKAFKYMFVYSGFVGVLLLLNGFGCVVVPLDPEVMKFLVGSTAVTVIGLVGMVLTGVFVGARK